MTNKTIMIFYDFSFYTFSWISSAFYSNWYVHTLRLKSLWPLGSVWGKTTLNTGSVGGAVVDPQTWKMRSSFLMSLIGTLYTNLQHFPIKWSFRRNSQTKISTFIVVKIGKFCLRVPPEAPFYWKLLKIGIRSAKDISKDVSILQEWGSVPTCI